MEKPLGEKEKLQEHSILKAPELSCTCNLILCLLFLHYAAVFNAHPVPLAPPGSRSLAGCGASGELVLPRPSALSPVTCHQC